MYLLFTTINTVHQNTAVRMTGNTKVTSDGKYKQGCEIL